MKWRKRIQRTENTERVTRRNNLQVRPKHSASVEWPSKKIEIRTAKVELNFRGSFFMQKTITRFCEPLLLFLFLKGVWCLKKELYAPFIFIVVEPRCGCFCR